MTHSQPNIAGAVEPRGVGTEFLLEEYRKYHEAFAKNEELGERRVQFFLGLITAAVGAIALLATADKGVLFNHPEYTSWTALGLSLLILAAGLLTYDRLLKRDETTKEYQALLDEVRRRFVIAASGDNRSVSLEGYDPFPKPKAPGQERKLLERVGRLGRMILVINAWIAGLVTVLFRACVSGWPRRLEDVLEVTVLAIVAMCVIAIGQWNWWRSNYRAPKQA